MTLYRVAQATGYTETHTDHDTAEAAEAHWRRLVGESKRAEWYAVEIWEAE
jgi:hypothetical protein